MSLDESRAKGDNNPTNSALLPNMMLPMDLLNIVGGLASVLGLGVSIYTLYKVETLPTALKRQSRDQQLTELIDKIVGMPPLKPKVSETTAREVEFLIQAIRTYYVSGLWFRHRELKIQLAMLERELEVDRRREIVQNQLHLIRHEIAAR